MRQDPEALWLNGPKSSIYSVMEFTAAQIAGQVNGELHGNPDVLLNRLRPIESAEAGDLSFFAPSSKRKTAELRAFAKRSTAGAIFVRTFEEEFPTTQIVVRNPHVAALEVALLFEPPVATPAGIHTHAIVSPSAKVGRNVHVGPFSVIGEGCEIGDDSIIHPHVVIYPYVRLGEKCIIHSGAVIRERVKIGSDCVIQSGVVVGGDGFGYLPDPQIGHRRIPHTGTVVLEDGVDLGANATIDRATFGETRVGKYTKIDNLVMLGHNVRVGERSIFCSQVGISGSTTVGSDVVLGGQVGAVDHITIGDRVRAGGQTGIVGDVEPGQDLWGMPHRPIMDFKREMISLRELPKLLKRFKKL